MNLCRALYIVPMAKPSTFVRAKHPLAPDLAADRTVLRGGATSRRRDLVFVVNPQGANGRTGKEWKKLLPFLRSRLGSDCNICECLTSGPCHAIDITREAICEGADAVIAVGGDGTLHEMRAFLNQIAEESCIMLRWFALH